MDNYRLEIIISTPAKLFLRLYEWAVQDDQDDNCVATYDVDLIEGKSVWYNITHLEEYLKKEASSSSQARLETLGKEFTDFFFHGPSVRQRLFVSQSVVQLIIDPVIAPPQHEDSREPFLTEIAAHLVSLPWDLARYQNNSLGRVSVRLQVSPPRYLHENTKAPKLSRIHTIQGSPVQGITTFRCLFCFASADDNSRLALQKERQDLEDLLLPLAQTHNLQIDILDRPVTRERLVKAIKNAKGYELIHFSGHGNRGFIALETDDGGADPVPAIELRYLISTAHTGFEFPRVLFLSTCYSGSISDNDSASQRQVLYPADASSKENKVPHMVSCLLETETNQTATTQIIAMRYSTSDSLALAFSYHFYERLFKVGDDAATALTQAREELDSHKIFPYKARFTPVLYGNSRVQIKLSPRAAESPGCRPLQFPLTNAQFRDITRPEFCLGRESELRKIHLAWSETPCTRPITILIGKEKVGKSTLAVEILHRWHRNFDFVAAIKGPMTAANSTATGANGEQAALSAQLIGIDVDLSHVFTRMKETPGNWNEFAKNLLTLCSRKRLLIVLDGVALSAPAWQSLIEEVGPQLGKTKSRLLFTTPDNDAIQYHIQEILHRPYILKVPIEPLDSKTLDLLADNATILAGLRSNTLASRQFSYAIYEAAAGFPETLNHLKKKR